MLKNTFSSVLHYKVLIFEEAMKAQVVLEMSAANRHFEHHQDVCIQLKNSKNDQKWLL